MRKETWGVLGHLFKIRLSCKTSMKGDSRRCCWYMAQIPFPETVHLFLVATDGSQSTFLDCEIPVSSYVTWVTMFQLPHL